MKKNKIDMLIENYLVEDALGCDTPVISLEDHQSIGRDFVPLSPMLKKLMEKKLTKDHVMHELVGAMGGAALGMMAGGPLGAVAGGAAGHIAQKRLEREDLDLYEDFDMMEEDLDLYEDFDMMEEDFDLNEAPTGSALKGLMKAGEENIARQGGYVKQVGNKVVGNPNVNVKQSLVTGGRRVLTGPELERAKAANMQRAQVKGVYQHNSLDLSEDLELELEDFDIELMEDFELESMDYV